MNSWFHRAEEIIFPDFCLGPTHVLDKKWHTLDIRRARYIKRTSSFRKIESMFVSFQPSTLANKVTPSTVGWWIKKCIAKVYKLARQ